jgi:hypothetical protein
MRSESSTVTCVQSSTSRFLFAGRKLQPCTGWQPVLLNRQTEETSEQVLLAAGKQQCRPEGPAFNSHAREGVVTTALKDLRPEGPALLVSRFHQSLQCAAPSALIGPGGFLIHALTGVAIECRPFGPKFRKLTSASPSDSAAQQLAQTFLKFVGHRNFELQTGYPNHARDGSAAVLSSRAHS